MTTNNILHLISIIGIALAVITVAAYALYKKASVFQKICTAINLLFIAAYSYLVEFLVDYCEERYGIQNDFNRLFSIFILLAYIIGVIIILIGTFYKNKRFQNISYNAYEIALLVVFTAMTINLFTSNVNSVFLFPVLILGFIITEVSVICSSEALQTKLSKLIYFIPNIIFTAFWIICYISLVSKFKFNNIMQLIIFTAIVLVLSLNPIIFGIIRIKKEKQND